MKLKGLLLLTCIVGAIFAIVCSWAAPPLGGFLPSSTYPEQVSKALRSEEQKPVETMPQQPTAPEPARSELPEETKKIKFKLNGIILTGNHIYPTSALQYIYKDKIGKNISIAELFTLIQNITNFYRNNGYILSRAILPEQQVKNGVVHIQVIEGYIGNVHVTGKPHGATCQVRAFGNKILECRPVQISRMEKYLILANEIPATQVKAVLEASHGKVPTLGSSDLNLVTENKPITGYASYDNYGTRYVGPQQMTGNIALNSFAASGDSGQITMVKTPKGGELTYIDANYNMPVYDNGVRLLFGGTRAQTHPLFVLRPLQIDGLNMNYYTMATFPIIRARTQSLTLRTGFNYLDSSTTTINNATLYTDHVRSLGFGGTYNFSDRWYGSNMISGDLRQGLPILGYTSNYNPDTAQTSRPGGHGVYTKIAMTVNRLQAIYGPISLSGLIQGQWGFNPLLASEQFAFGGPQLGRGYDIAEILGDRGLAGSLELRYDKPIGRLYISNLQFYIFYDAGMVWNYLFIGGTPRKQSGTSTGIGVRFYMTKYVSGNFMWTQTLTKPVATEELINRGRRPRTWFSVVASFG